MSALCQLSDICLAQSSCDQMPWVCVHDGQDFVWWFDGKIWFWLDQSISELYRVLWWCCWNVVLSGSMLLSPCCWGRVFYLQITLLTRRIVIEKEAVLHARMRTVCWCGSQLGTRFAELSNKLQEVKRCPCPTYIPSQAIHHPPHGKQNMITPWQPPPDLHQPKLEFKSTSLTPPIPTQIPYYKPRRQQPTPINNSSRSSTTPRTQAD
jgi:hypothetical protein